jgi:hypothetical protein
VLAKDEPTGCLCFTATTAVFAIVMGTPLGTRLR